MSRRLGGALYLCTIGFSLAIPAIASAQSSSTPAVPVKVTNTPTVTVGNPLSNPVPIVGTVQVLQTGTVYSEILGVSINVNGAVAGPAGSAVPPGRRRIVTSVSARWTCDPGHRALVQIFGNTALFLAGLPAYTDSSGREVFAMVNQVNVVQDAGTQWVPIIESDGSSCLADIFVSGIETPAP